jgi:hypothetical protein
MGKGMAPKKRYNDKLYKENYDDIKWNSDKISNGKSNKTKGNRKKSR